MDSVMYILTILIGNNFETGLQIDLITTNTDFTKAKIQSRYTNKRTGAPECW